MNFTLKHWVGLHAVSARQTRTRWLATEDKNPRDPLLKPERFADPTSVWTVESELELVRLIGALHWLNPDLSLWFRGEGQYRAKALPRRYRPGTTNDTKLGIEWLNEHAGEDRSLRDRRPLARAAILQHYGCPTSLLDVSASYDVACAFAFEEKATGQSHLRVYALPRHTQPVTVFDDSDVVLVDLRAELPSYCLRPHVQQAAFIARREAAYSDIEGSSLVPEGDAELDSLCIAHIKLAFDGADRFYVPRKAAGALYPPASDNMTGDFLLHLLRRLALKHKTGLPQGFPDNR